MMLTGIYINLANVFYMHHCFHDSECFIWIKCACRGAGRDSRVSIERARESEGEGEGEQEKAGQGEGGYFY